MIRAQSIHAQSGVVAGWWADGKCVGELLGESRIRQLRQ